MWPAEMVRLVKEQFVAVATTLHGRPEDEEGKFFNSLKCAWGTGRYHAVTPGGKPLCAPDGDSFCCNVPAAWERWKALPPGERRPGAVRVSDLATYDPAFRKRPAGSIVLKSYNRILEKEPQGDWRRKTGTVHRLNLNQNESEPRWIKDPEPGRTWVWLDEAQWRSLVPAQPKQGASVPVPAAVADRLLRLTMLDTVYCFSWPWGGGSFRSKELALKVEKVGPEVLTLRLEGAVLFEEPARTYDATLAGVLEVDSKTKEFKRIEITALGDWTWPKRKANARQVLGVSIELWPHRFASPAYDRFFPGFSMEHYGYDQSKE